MESRLTVTTATDNGVATLTIAGELDPSSAPTLDEAVGSALDTGGVDRVMLDLAGVEFIDSSGLTVLIRAHERGEVATIPIKITNPSPHCLRLLTLTKLDHLLA
jgi:anti-sigma B factor antagonist